ncbi:MAG: winged helix-turn-helix transcriptional regulator [Myxococcales bacterium]|nr:winged helix-turn-helix transcriptional regulator [Myxococcales bacterium]
MAEHVTREAFEAVRDASVGQLLMKAGRLVNERALARVPEGPGGLRLRPSHTALFPHVDFEGTRMSTLAERLGVTKQAVSQLVGDLEVMGVLRRTPDPSDGRAKLVVFADEGLAIMMHGLSVLATVDAELEETLGERRYATLRRALGDVVARLEEG